LHKGGAHAVVAKENQRDTLVEKEWQKKPFHEALVIVHVSQEPDIVYLPYLILVEEIHDVVIRKEPERAEEAAAK